MPLFLAPFLTSCATQAVHTVDPALTLPCNRPELIGDTWRDLGEAFVRRGAAIDECNKRLEVIRNGK
jgi:hypothetical protein